MNALLLILASLALAILGTLAIKGIWFRSEPSGFFWESKGTMILTLLAVVAWCVLAPSHGGISLTVEMGGNY